MEKFVVGTTSQPIAASVRQRIHKRMIAYDGMTVHPDIGPTGTSVTVNGSNTLPDDNEPEGACPFQTRTDNTSLSRSSLSRDMR